MTIGPRTAYSTSITRGFNVFIVNVRLISDDFSILIDRQQEMQLMTEYNSLLSRSFVLRIEEKTKWIDQSTLYIFTYILYFFPNGLSTLFASSYLFSEIEREERVKKMKAIMHTPRQTGIHILRYT